MKDTTVVFIAICLCIVLVIATISWPDVLQALGDFIERLLSWWQSGGNGNGNGNGGNGGNGTYPPQHPIVEDDFNIQRDWWNMPDAFSYTPDGKLRGHSITAWPNPCKIALNTYITAQDGSLSVSVWIEAGSAKKNAYLILRYKDGTGYYAGMMQQQNAMVKVGAYYEYCGYAIGRLVSNGIPQTPLVMTDGGAGRPLILSKSIQTNYEYRLEFEALTVEGTTTLTLTVDGQVMLQSTDLTYNRAGSFGLGIYTSTVQFDNFKFISYD